MIYWDDETEGKGELYMFVSAVYIRLVATIDVLLHIGCLFWTYGAHMCISHFLKMMIVQVIFWMLIFFVLRLQMYQLHHNKKTKTKAQVFVENFQNQICLGKWPEMLWNTQYINGGAISYQFMRVLDPPSRCPNPN